MNTYKITKYYKNKKESKCSLFLIKNLTSSMEKILLF